MSPRTKAGVGGGVALLLTGSIFVALLDSDEASGPGASREVDSPRRVDPAQPAAQGLPVGGAGSSSSPAGPARLPRNPPGVDGVDGDPGPVSVTFRCVDSSGAPLPGVRVEALRQSGAPLAPATSDAKGIARIGGLPAGEHITGVGRHSSSSEGTAFGPVKLGAHTIVTLRFTPSELGRLSGRMVDDQGQPVTDAELILVNPKHEGKVLLDALGMSLRGDGSFLTEVGVGTYTVSARGPGLTESAPTDVVVEAGGEVEHLEFVLPRAGSISGVIRLPPDLQISLPVDLDVVCEVQVDGETPRSRTRRAPLKVGADGVFRLDDCEAGRYQLRLEIPQPGSPRVGPWTHVVMSPGQQVEAVVLSLAEVQLAVQGVARDERGVSLKGVVVSVGSRKATTDAEGRYEIRGLDVGAAALEGKLSNHSVAHHGISYQGAALTLDLVLTRLGGVRGVVRGASGPMRVLIVFKRADGARPYEVQADAKGSYLKEGLPPGDYYLRAGPGADAFDDAGAPTVRVEPGRTVEAVPIRAE